MEIVLAVIAAFAASLVSFFSGFGLGTILLPVFALFFSPELAVALTGVIHLFNNIMKVSLTGRNADRTIIFWFGIPALIAAFPGALLLLSVSRLPSVYEYEIGTHLHVITPVKLIISGLLLFFVLFELVPSSSRITPKRSLLPLGGILSGFLGGLSGLQGAVRSAFLVRSGLTKEGYIATAAVIALMVDITRLSVYASRYTGSGLSGEVTLLVFSILAAFAGVLAGNRLLKKVTFGFIKVLVAVMLVILSVAMGAGLI